jgi:hypothetical protein
MQFGDSSYEDAQLRRARALLANPGPDLRVWPALAAASFAAIAALTLAVAMVVAPPAVTSHLPAEDLTR